MNILFGTDFSANAQRAGTAAAHLAARLSDTLHLVHAFESEPIEPLSPAVRKSLLARLRERLENEASQLRASGSAIQTDLLNGPADEAMLSRISPTETRLVVVSSLGHRKPGRWLIGNVAERIAESSPVPTLVVRQEELIAEWTAGHRPLRVLCAHDFSPPSRSALEYLKELRQIGPLEIVVAQVDWPPAEKHRLGIPGAQPLEANQAEVQRLLERDLRERVTALLGTKNVRVLVEPSWGRPDLRLIELAEREKADLIVTGTHQRQGVERLWHASTSRGILLQAPLNVLVVPHRPPAATSALPTLRRILVSTDFSTLGNEAIPLAYATLPTGGLVKLVTVILPWEVPGPLVPHYQSQRQTRKKHEQQAAESLKQLRALIPAEAEARGIATEAEVIEGHKVAEVLGQAAERFGADLICLASHGRSGIARAFLGSVAQEVLSQSLRPVLVVRSKIR